jgi:flavin-dependent dehydrogenase
MGLQQSVDREASRFRGLRVYAPNGTVVDLNAEFLCLSRLRFDSLLVETAESAGSRLLGGMTALAPVIDSDRVIGARFKTGSTETTIRARQTVLATGANATTLRAFGLTAGRSTLAVAGRAYFRVPEPLARRFSHFCIAYDRYLCRGYGWIFPGPDNCFNVGVGSFSGRLSAGSLPRLWQTFITRFEPAATLVAQSQQLTPFRGAPLRTGLSGAEFGRPGLIVVGEAASTTYPCTGEGIGKAMESGLLAAEFVADALAVDPTPRELYQKFGAEFTRRFMNRYHAYRVGESWTSRPWLLNLLARCANVSSPLRRQLEALIDERDGVCRLFAASS